MDLVSFLQTRVTWTKSLFWSLVSKYLPYLKVISKEKERGKNRNAQHKIKFVKTTMRSNLLLKPKSLQWLPTSLQEKAKLLPKKDQLSVSPSPFPTALLPRFSSHIDFCSQPHFLGTWICSSFCLECSSHRPSPGSLHHFLFHGRHV